MRGKLRDKRAISKRDSGKRELVERRKPSKRDTRSVALWLNQEPESDELDLLLEEEDDEMTDPVISNKK